MNHTTDIAPGIVFLETPGHGYVLLSPDRNERVHAALRREDARYEEDLDANIAALTFPEAFPNVKTENAKRTLINWYPDEMRAAGYEFTDDESMKLRERAYFVANTGKMLAKAASCRNVPKNMVLVYAERCDGTDIYRNVPREGAYYLVPSTEYKTKPIFVIDESRHARATKDGSPLESEDQANTDTNTERQPTEARPSCVHCQGATRRTSAGDIVCANLRCFAYGS